GPSEFGAAVALRGEVAVVERIARAQVDRHALQRHTVLHESRDVPHLGLLGQRRLEQVDLRRYAAGANGDVARQSVSSARVAQAVVVEDVERVGAGWRPPVLETRLQLVAGAEEPVNVARDADVRLDAVRIAEALARRLGTVDVDARGDVVGRRMLLRRRKRLELLGPVARP